MKMQKAKPLLSWRPSGSVIDPRSPSFYKELRESIYRLRMPDRRLKIAYVAISGGDPRIDPACWWVGIQDDPDPLSWRATKVIYVDEGTSGGLHEIQLHLTGQNGLPSAGQLCWHDWPDGKIPLYTDAAGFARIEIWSNGFDPNRNSGPYRIYVDGKSSVVYGMGLPLSRHVIYKVFMQQGNVLPPTGGGGITEAQARAIAREEIGKARIVVG